LEGLRFVEKTKKKRIHTKRRKNKRTTDSREKPNMDHVSFKKLPLTSFHSKSWKIPVAESSKRKFS